MSKDIENRTTSKLFLNTDSSPASTSEAEKASITSIKSLKFPFSSISKTSTKFKDQQNSSSPRFSDDSEEHYISRVQPKYVSCSFKSIESDECVMPEENVEYSCKLDKEMSIQKIHSSIYSDESKTTEDSFPFEVIPLKDLAIRTPLEPNEKQSSKDICVNSVRKDTFNISASVRNLDGPRMTTSDSFMSINRKHLQDIDRRFITSAGKEVQASQTPSASGKPTAVSIQNNSNAESEQTSSSTPVSIFENEKYKTITDSNSHDEGIVECINPGNIHGKSKTGKVEFKKGMELKNSSLLSIPSTVCRICHTDTANEKLLSPCYCKGSLAYVHLSCLERWLNQSSRSYCELCLYQYNAVETLRYGFLEGIRLWIRHPRNRNHVRSDCLIAFLLTLVTMGLMVITFIGMDYFMIEGIKLGLSKMWTKSFIVSFLSVVMMGYIVTMYLIAKDQFVPWYTWWKNTLNIRLLLSPTVLQTQRI